MWTIRVPRSVLLGVGFLFGARDAAAQLTVTLTPTDFNGFHISCFGAHDGAIDATVSGGTPPYSYSWTNSSTDEDLTDLAAGYYKLVVTDALSEAGEAEITLAEPLELRLGVVPFTYPSGHHISCNECFNGSIDITVTYGVPPYTYLWGDGATTADRTALGALTYGVIVTDANGCEVREGSIVLTQPERDDWRMDGNAGTDPASQYIGTSDARDLVFKSNGQERLRLLSGGSLKMFGSGIGTGPMQIDADGTLRGGGFPSLGPLPSELCRLLDSWPYWETRGNDFTTLCPEEIPLLGTLSEHDVRVITHGQIRMQITTTGKVGIGTEPPAGPVEEYRLFVEDGIVTRDVLVKLGVWPDYVFSDGYRLMPLTELRAFLKRHSHLPGIPSAAELSVKGGVELGDMQRRMLEVVEQQALYILQLEERVKRLEAKNGIH